MSRHIFQGYWGDENGRAVSEGTVNVYLASTSTAASIYTASSGGSAVNSVESSSNGTFEFYVDEADYSPTQLFKMSLTKTNYTTTEYDDLSIFPVGKVHEYTVATLPSVAAHTATVVYVSDETGGATLAFSDGTNWKRVQDLATVSDV